MIMSPGGWAIWALVCVAAFVSQLPSSQEYGAGIGRAFGALAMRRLARLQEVHDNRRAALDAFGDRLRASWADQPICELSRTELHVREQMRRAGIRPYGDGP
jgi:hypothetical protein